MKNIILFALLIAASCAIAQFSSDAFNFVPRNNTRVDCLYYETYTPWAVVGVLEIQSCQHDWAYAEKCDVNPCSDVGISDAVYYGPCGKPIHEKEGRICRKCSQVEARERTYGFKIVGVPKSEYKTLLEKIKD